MRRLLADCGCVVLVLGLVTILVSCATKKVDSSTSESSALQSAPLRDFSKNPVDEVVRPPETAIVAKKEAPNAALKMPSRELANIYFAFDKWSLSSNGKKDLNESVEALKQNPEAQLVVEGYCDERGSREYNLVLGDKRAKEAMRYLTALGIKNPVRVISYGEERPVCEEHDESCYWKNRRAHVLIEEGK